MFIMHMPREPTAMSGYFYYMGVGELGNEDLTRILLDKMEAVLARTNDLADNLNKMIGRLESKETQCTQHIASIARCHVRVDDMEKEISQFTGARMIVAWLVTTGIAVFALLRH